MRQMQSGETKRLVRQEPREALLEHAEKVTFKDVAGVDEAKRGAAGDHRVPQGAPEIPELGGRIPKGCSSWAPPAPARRCSPARWPVRPNVPFFSSAARTSSRCSWASARAACRDLFRAGQEERACIIFMTRSTPSAATWRRPGGGHDERELTLNQLLVEDGRLRVERGRHPGRRHPPPRCPRPGPAPPAASTDASSSTSGREGREGILSVHTRRSPSRRRGVHGARPRRTSGSRGRTWRTW